MTVAELTPYIEYTENGVTLNWAAPFRYGPASNLEVSRQLADGTVTVLTMGVDWTAPDGPTDAGGTVTLSATVAGATLKIRRVTPRTQQTDYGTHDNFPAETHEGALDKLTQIAQEIEVDIDLLEARALLVPVGETAPVLRSLEGAADGTMLGFLGGEMGPIPEGGDASALRADLASGSGAALMRYLLGRSNAVARTVQNRLDDDVSVKSFGAKGDTRSVANCTYSGGNTLVCAAAAFTSADIGKKVAIPGAGLAGALLITTIVGILSSTQALCAQAAFTNVVGITVSIGTDDTAAIQAAINEVLPSGGGLKIPYGTYWVQGKLVVPASSGWRLYGEGRNGSRLMQVSDNTRILSLEYNNTHSFEIHGLYFEWKLAQPAANTNAVGVFMGTGAPTAEGFWHFSIHHCAFARGFRAIAGDPANSPAIWGAHVHDNFFESDMSGASFFAVPSPAVGQPRICFENNLVMATSQSEAMISILSGDNVAIIGNEFLGGVGTWNLVTVTTSSPVLFMGNKSEAWSAGAAGAPAVFQFPQSDVIAINNSVNGIAGSGAIARALKAGAGGSLSIFGFSGAANMTAGAALVYEADNLPFVAGLKLNLTGSGHFREDLRTFAGAVPVPRLHADRRQIDALGEVGDASVTLTSASDRIQSANSTLTANRSITLPNGGGGAYDMMEFIVVRRAGAPGAFTLTVTDPMSGNNFVFPANTKGFVHYRCLNGNTWRILASSLHATDTGWTAGTGTALKGAFAAYAGTTHTGAYVQASVQAADDAARNASQRVLALENALRSAGIIAA